MKDFANYTRPRPVRYLVYSVFLEFVAWSILLLFSFIVYLVSAVRTFESFYDLSDLMLGLILLFIALRRVGKRFRLVSKKMLLTAERKPIIYLRSFYEEFKPDAIYSDKTKTDETLAQVLKTTGGPLIAVGKPDDKLQPLGAIRVYFNDEVWRDNVEVLMDMSRLVIIQAGLSTGLQWEIDTAIKQLKPEQLLFTFLSWQELDGDSRQSKYEKFATQLKSIFATQLKSIELKSISKNLNLPARIDGAYFLYFDKDWNPHLASLSGWKRYFFYLASLPIILLKAFAIGSQGTFNKAPVQLENIFRKSSVASVREALRPVLKRQGINLPVGETIIYISLVIAVAASLVFFIFRVAIKLSF